MTTADKQQQIAAQAKRINEAQRAKRAFPGTWAAKDAMQRDIDSMCAQLYALTNTATNMTTTTPRRKPGPARGTPTTGHRPKEPHNPGQHDFWTTWQLWPASNRPSIKAMAAALGCHPQTFARKMRADNQGRGLSPEELHAATGLLMAL